MTTTENDRRGALEAIDRILNRGGDADDVLRSVVDVLARLYCDVAIDFVEEERLVRGPASGAPTESVPRYPIVFRSTRVAELVAPAAPDDAAFLERVATLISPYCLVGWDTSGERWEP